MLGDKTVRGNAAMLAALSAWSSTSRTCRPFFLPVEIGLPASTRLDVLAITPTTAVVRVNMEGDAIGADYTDFHTLIKLGDTWRIVAKVYRMYEG